MSVMECPVVRVKIEPHPQADKIEIALVGGYKSIVRKGQFESGGLAVYIPEGALLPEWLLREMEMWDELNGCGTLHGGAGNRVKAKKLRGIMSQGLLYPIKYSAELHHASYTIRAPVMGGVGLSDITVGSTAQDDAEYDIESPIGVDVSDILGITKYEQPVPSNMRGKILGVNAKATHKYDFENIKKNPNLFVDGEKVVVTEKIHGTLLQLGIVPSNSAYDQYYDSRVIVTSKGMGANGFVLDHNDNTNLYVQTATEHQLFEKAKFFYEMADSLNLPVFIFGEVYGKTKSGAGIQDLTYTGETLGFRCFDICIGNRGNETFLNWDEFVTICDSIEIPRTEALFVGPYSLNMLLAHTSGNTTLTKNKQIREGVVVKSYHEDKSGFGRKIAKSVSDDYLLRKSGTEFN